jgi:hypothetical protein
MIYWCLLPKHYSKMSNFALLKHRIGTNLERVISSFKTTLALLILGISRLSTKLRSNTPGLRKAAMRKFKFHLLMTGLILSYK